MPHEREGESMITDVCPMSRELIKRYEREQAKWGTAARIAGDPVKAGIAVGIEALTGGDED
jgi:hypothetical protein